MEVGSGRGWRWFPSGIEAFCEDEAAKRAWGRARGISGARAIAARASVQWHSD